MILYIAHRFFLYCFITEITDVKELWIQFKSMTLLKLIEAKIEYTVSTNSPLGLLNTSPI